MNKKKTTYLNFNTATNSYTIFIVFKTNFFFVLNKNYNISESEVSCLKIEKLTKEDELRIDK